VPGEEGEKAMEIIERAMGKPISSLFKSISSSPIGAASIGQVHKAVLNDGRECVIKIQYPNCRQIFQWDIRSAKLVS
jgi:predicted unusual protein kinase regulating ubiquinone biosynthesis (AarF/ABC1/UbiB family)